MAVLRDHPYPSMNFVVDLGDGTVEGPEAGLAEVILPDARVHVVEYRNGNDKNPAPQKITTTTEYTNLILKRGAIGSLNWHAWWDQVRNGDQDGRRTVLVRLLDEERATIVLSWKFLRARPVSHRFAPLLALGGTQALIETLELAFERLEME